MHFIDSHTAGEPTRVIIEGGPDLGVGSLLERLQVFRRDFDHVRSMIINEPRGSEAMVGALLCSPNDSACDAGIIFFNNTGYLNMCGHGAIGVAVTLQYMGRLSSNICRLETPVGIVEAKLHSPNRVSIENVESYVFREQVEIDVDSVGRVVGDIAWGGNWFFLIENSPVEVNSSNLEILSTLARKIRSALDCSDIRGEHGALIDHIEFFGPPHLPNAHSKNFVYCPGGAYDRSPCGTGTSAKLACLAYRGKLAPGQTWVQESIIGSSFEACYILSGDDKIIPSITGEAYICSEGRLVLQAGDPFFAGITFLSHA